MELGSTMRVLRPAEGVLAFYDGRVPGVRAWAETPNWLDDGAYDLGIASYALVDGDAALVYDSHISPAHAALVRGTLAAAGVRDITLVLSHWHKDHVAGNAVFADCTIIAHRATADLLAANRAAIEAADPPIRPLVLPTRTYDERLSLAIGRTTVDLIHADIHSRDGTVLFRPDDGLLLAGDTLEDPLTYVAEPDRLAVHRAALTAMAAWPIRSILPNHGSHAQIAAGGYDPGLIGATIRYVDFLLAVAADPRLADRPPELVLADELAAGTITWFEPYAAVHRDNLARLLGRR